MVDTQNQFMAAHQGRAKQGGQMLQIVGCALVVPAGELLAGVMHGVASAKLLHAELRGQGGNNCNFNTRKSTRRGAARSKCSTISSRSRRETSR